MTVTALSTSPAEYVSRGTAVVEAVRALGVDHIGQATAALTWAARTFGDSMVVMSSMGDNVLVHLASQAVPNVQVAFIDTGYHFPETIGTADASELVHPIRLLRITPTKSVAEQDAEHGPELFRRDPDLCCRMRKVEPLERALAGRDAWVTGMRRADSATRADTEIIALDAKRGMVKINPLAMWTDEQVEAYIRDNNVLMNPLIEHGYPSIGCAPCTKAVAPGEDPRSGRWAGTGKTECGLHL